MTHTPMTIEELKAMARVIRRDIITMIHTAQAGHPGGSLSAADIVTALYFRIMRIDPAESRTGPTATASSCRRATPARSGTRRWPSAASSTRRTWRRCASSTASCRGTPDMKKTPGIDMTVGSLGQGISAGLGMALAGKLRKKDYHVWVMIGDGESQEGSVWEAAMAAPKLEARQPDRHRGQQRHPKRLPSWTTIMPVEPVADKWRAFSWNVIEIDGHKMEEIVPALEDGQGPQGGADRHHCQDGQGQRRLFHGERARLARQAPPNEARHRPLAEITEGLR